MTEELQSKRGLAGWIKAGLTSLCGLVSGAVLMYLTPLIDSVIKPAKPIANFEAQVQGLNVAFNNRSVGGTQGWWDFGDGSALEPFSPTQESVRHTYPYPGSYSVKLSLQNLLNEQNERASTIHLDMSSVPKPAIAQFVVTPEKTNRTDAAGKFIAPAVFRIQAKLENAELCVWALGSSRALEVSADTAANQDRLVTLKRPGTHTLRLVAINGKESAEKSQDILVAAAEKTDADAPQARLRVTYAALATSRLSLPVNVIVPWTSGHKETTCPFERTLLLDNAHKDCQILAAEVRNKQDPKVRNLQVDIAPDRTKFTVRGELVHEAHWWKLKKQAPPPWVAEVVLSLEKRSAPQEMAMDEIPVNVRVPGTTAIPMPRLSSGWQMTGKRLHLELWDGNRVAWSGEQPPTRTVLQLAHRPVLVSAVEQGEFLVLQVSDATPTPARPLGN
jgi:hypothetical protein